MSSPVDQNQQNTPPLSDKEMNFRNLEARYEKQLSLERAARLEAERNLAERNKVVEHEDDDTSEPYVDHKKLEKKLQKFGQQSKQDTQSEIQKGIQQALQEERKQNWIKQTPDFYDVLKHAEKLAVHDPDLAESILEMPEGFARQQLVYKNIKALGLNRDAPKVPTIQEKIDANRRSPYYQPSSVGSAPYSSQGDFSQNGQKEAYAKMQELKSRLRI